MVRARAAVVALAALVGLVAVSGAGAQLHATAAATPTCDRHAARSAIPKTDTGKKFLKPLMGMSWSLAALQCVKLMGRHRGTDMIAVATCCTAASPTPLFIFRPSGSSWKLAFSSDKLIDGLEHRGSTLIEKRPIYHRNTPLCCPAGFTYWSIQYRHGDWVVQRTHKPPP